MQNTQNIVEKMSLTWLRRGHGVDETFLANFPDSNLKQT